MRIRPSSVNTSLTYVVGGITVGNSTVTTLSANSTTVVVNTGFYANGSLGTAGQVLVSNGTGVYWSSTVGYTGSAGSLGFTGSIGYTGSFGSTGYTGSAGSTGAIGFTGSQGGTGYDGSQGSLGYTGSTGYVGSAGIGYAGSLGSLGYTGSAGFTGSIGTSANLNIDSYSFTGNGSNTVFTLSNPVTQNTIIVTINGIVQAPITSYSVTNSNNNINFVDAPGANSFVEVKVLSGGLGYTGSQGPAGGYTGSQGGTGYTGSIGSLGYTGSTGAGFTGSQGGTGYIGSKGDVGYTGSFGSTGFTGSVGYTGSAGFTGSVGYTGSVGFTGSFGYSGSVGFVGSTGSLGYTGSTGAGYTGSAGTTGYTGSTATSNAVSTQYTANGTQTTFALTSNAVNQNNFIISLNGLVQYPVTHYTISGNTLSFTFTPPNNSVVEVRDLENGSGVVGYTGSQGPAGGYTGSIGSIGYTGSTGPQGTIGYTGSIATANASSQTFTSNGSNTVYTLSASVANHRNIIVTLDGLVQVPNTHYTISGTTLTFTSVPVNNTSIEIRNFETGTGQVGYTGSAGTGGSTVNISDTFVSVFLLGL